LSSKSEAQLPDGPESTPERHAVRASVYSYDELAAIYNESRTDYIVPMPMNARRMQEYVTNYDIDLDASFVSLNIDELETGVGMLGLRDERSWITRLGVIPYRRQKRVGQYLMELMLQASVERNVRLVQLEVIVGNEPAHNLFLKLGFEPTRELLIIRRPPGAPDPIPAYDEFTPQEVPEGDIPHMLEGREVDPSWVEENSSLLNAGSLRGFHLEVPDGRSGWVIFQRTPFQLTHFVISGGIDADIARILLYHIHKAYPMQDTKTENLPENHRMWPIFQEAGYFEVFRRTEMFLYLR